MAFGGFEPEGERGLLSEINVTPLVDVMLVLLIIFMVTAPLFTHAVKIDLPQASSQIDVGKPDTIALSIDAAGGVFWNDVPVASTELPVRFAAAARQDPQPELHLRAHRDTRYERVAQVMAAAQVAGLRRIGFVTDPSLVR